MDALTGAPNVNNW